MSGVVKAAAVAAGVVIAMGGIAVGGAFLVASLRDPGKKPVPTKTALDYKRDDLHNVEVLLQWDLDRAHKEGASPADLEAIQAQYRDEIARLKQEIAQGEGKSP